MRMSATMYLALSLCLSPLALFGCASSVNDTGAPFNPRMQSDGGGVFMPQPPMVDMGPVDLTGGALPCTVAPQGGCPSGQKCTTYDYATTRCEQNGTAQRGGKCVQVPDDCVPGNLCVAETPDARLTQCRPFCSNDAQCGNGSYCDLPLIGGNMKVCTNPCDPQQATTCQSGLGCYLYGAEHSDCVPPGTKPLNGSCNSYADCQPGLMCIPKGTSGVCHSVCKIGGTACAGIEICTQISDGSYNWRTYGVCCPNGNC